MPLSAEIKDFPTTSAAVNDLIKFKMPKYFQGLLRLLGQVADKTDLPVYVGGGFVRDLILGLKSNDLDLIIVGDALKYASQVNKLFCGKLIKNEQFGTARITTAKCCLDFSSARQEFYPFSASPPQTKSAGLREDLFRRDFTVNTLAFQLNTANFGNFFDYYNGLADLKEGLIRILYKLSFIDDPTRIIRAVRFEAKLGFVIEPETLNLIGKALKSKALSRLTKDKLTKEMILLFKEEKVLPALERLYWLGAGPQIFPDVHLDSRKIQQLSKIEKIITWAKKNTRANFNPHILYICAIIYGEKELNLFSQLRRFRLSRQDRATIAFTLQHTESLVAWLKEKEISSLEIYNLFNKIPLETIYFILAIDGGEVALERYDLYANKLCHITPSLTGEDLIGLGYRPGPVFKEILESIKAEKIKGNITTLEAEIHYVNKYFSNKKGTDV